MSYDKSAQAIKIQNKLVLGELTGATPAVVWFKGRFWVAWVGFGNQNLNIVGMDPGPNDSWVENPKLKQTLASTSDRAPALATDGQTLWMAFVGVGNHNVNLVSSVNGNDFTPASKVILSVQSSQGPSLTFFKGKLWLGWTGVNGQDFSVMGPAANGHFDLSTRHTFPEETGNAPFVAVGAICEYQESLNVITTYPGQPNSDNITRYLLRDVGVPWSPPEFLTVKGQGMRCAVHGNDLWITAFFTTGMQTSGGGGSDPVYGNFFWYLYRINNNDIVGAGSFPNDEAQGFASLAISDSGIVAMVWRGTDNPSHVNFGLLPYITGR